MTDKLDREMIERAAAEFKNNKVTARTKKNKDDSKKLLEKFEAAESVVESQANNNLYVLRETPPPVPDFKNEDSSWEEHKEHIEEIVLWKKRTSKFKRDKEQVGVNSADLIKKFEYAVRSVNPKASIGFTYTTDIITLRTSKRLEKFTVALQDNPDIMLLSPNCTYKVDIFPDGNDSICISLLFEMPSEYIQKRQQTIRRLYKMKCRYERSQIQIKIQHNRDMIEVSNVIGLKFRFLDKTLDINPPLIEKRLAV